MGHTRARIQNWFGHLSVEGRCYAIGLGVVAIGLVARLFVGHIERLNALRKVSVDRFITYATFHAFLWHAQKVSAPERTRVRGMSHISRSSRNGK